MQSVFRKATVESKELLRGVDFTENPAISETDFTELLKAIKFEDKDVVPGKAKDGVQRVTAWEPMTTGTDVYNRARISVMRLNAATFADWKKAGTEPMLEYDTGDEWTYTKEEFSLDDGSVSILTPTMVSAVWDIFAKIIGTEDNVHKAFCAIMKSLAQWLKDVIEAKALSEDTKKHCIVALIWIAMQLPRHKTVSKAKAKVFSNLTIGEAVAVKEAETIHSTLGQKVTKDAVPHANLPDAKTGGTFEDGVTYFVFIACLAAGRDLTSEIDSAVTFRKRFKNQLAHVTTWCCNKQMQRGDSAWSSYGDISWKGDEVMEFFSGPAKLLKKVSQMVLHMQFNRMDKVASAMGLYQTMEVNTDIANAIDRVSGGVLVGLPRLMKIYMILDPKRTKDSLMAFVLCLQLMTGEISNKDSAERTLAYGSVILSALGVPDALRMLVAKLGYIKFGSLLWQDAGKGYNKGEISGHRYTQIMNFRKIITSKVRKGRIAIEDLDDIQAHFRDLMSGKFKTKANTRTTTPSEQFNEAVHRILDIVAVTESHAGIQVICKVYEYGNPTDRKTASDNYEADPMTASNVKEVCLTVPSKWTHTSVETGVKKIIKDEHGCTSIVTVSLDEPIHADHIQTYLVGVFAYLKTHLNSADGELRQMTQKFRDQQEQFLIFCRDTAGFLLLRQVAKYSLVISQNAGFNALGAKSEKAIAIV